MLVFVAIAMVGLLGMLALTLDVGSGNRQRRIAQTAADAGAIGGGTQIYRNLDSASVDSVARRNASLNGFSGAEVTVNYPPKSGPHLGDKQYVEVLINKTLPSLFGRIFNVDSVQVKARAVAGTGAFSTLCVFGLGTSGTVLDIPANGGLQTNCGIAVNSTDSKAIDNKFNIEAPFVSVVGGITGGTSGSLATGSAPAVDPYAYLQVPAETGCDFNNTVVSGTVSLSPGVYCGGITIGKNDQANLAAGTYVVRGGGVSGGSITGNGVTIIIANGPGNDQSAYRPMTFPQSCNVSLTAPTSGPFKGVVLFGDPAGPASGPNSLNDFCGKGDTDITGTIYFPVQCFNLGNGNGKLTLTGTLAAKCVTETNGGARLSIIFDTSGNSAPRRLALVE
jgi:hypothetical protein